MRRHWKSLCLSLSLLCAGCEDAYFLMTEEFLRDREGNERYFGGSCEMLRAGVTDVNGTGGENRASYTVEHRHDDEGIEVVVRDGEGSVLVTKHYDRAFLASGEVDELVADLGNGERLRRRYWGSDECDPIREPHVD